MKITICGGHDGFPLKTVIANELDTLGQVAHDCDAAVLVRDARSPRFCEIGQSGYPSAATRTARCQGAENDDMNVLCLGGRVAGEALTAESVATFPSVRYSSAGRHRRRRSKVAVGKQGKMADHLLRRTI